jgi:hypothetical protein
VASVDEHIRDASTEYFLATHQWSGGAVEPKGFLNIESFRLEGMKPVWTYALADALLEKRVWMGCAKEKILLTSNTRCFAAVTRWKSN